MHYLNQLSFKLLRTAKIAADYEDDAAIAMLRKVLEQEIAAGRMRYETDALTQSIEREQMSGASRDHP